MLIAFSTDISDIIESEIILGRNNITMTQLK